MSFCRCLLPQPLESPSSITPKHLNLRLCVCLFIPLTTYCADPLSFLPYFVYLLCLTQRVKVSRILLTTLLQLIECGICKEGKQDTAGFIEATSRLPSSAFALDSVTVRTSTLHQVWTHPKLARSPRSPRFPTHLPHWPSTT